MNISRLALAAPLVAVALSACQQQRSDTVRPDTEQPQPISETPAVEPKSIIRPTVIEETPPPPVIAPATTIIQFADKTTSLSEEARVKLDAFAAAPAVQAGGEIAVRGHSDSRGHDADNRIASRHRAEAVRDYLAGIGVVPERMKIVALGETRPIAPNAMPDGSDYPEGRARNRRVEVVAEPPATVGDSPTTEPGDGL